MRLPSDSGRAFAVASPQFSLMMLHNKVGEIPEPPSG
jgi:hypothetical protein